ncbi:unnamed protein product [Clonostachys rosea f. rosea IK726]|uniref:Major facilitator superfamily (MFS) profile domain-containing protein n=2 Tax=Bionectria ochroleuca TaxID=29856 RepID=A0A0B7KHP2_BIOOC|nr:unnamed protein product [Clonostachys rosea f. rosea IK726]
MSLPLNDSAGVSDRPAGSRGSEEHEALISDSLLAENHQFIGLTEEDNKRIRRKTDLHILTILVWVYFLQILDKSVLGYGAIFGLREDCELTGNQYSMVSSASAVAQLLVMPLTSWIMVRVPHRTLMASLVLGWGAAQTFMAACNGFTGLLITRFLLGVFEAGCLPLFSIITSQWYRRAEQPIRVAAWYGTNGLSTMLAAAVSNAFGHIHSGVASWRILFLFVGLMTVLSSPVVYYIMDSDISTAWFLTKRERLQALERLRTNKTGIGSHEFKWNQAFEGICEIKSLLFVGMAVCINVTAAVANTFGPIVVEGFGFSPEKASLLNIPFGAVQLLVIFPASYLAHRFRIKSLFLSLVLLPVLGGSIMLHVLDRDRTILLLAAYYALAFVFGANPLLVSWIISNVGGTTKKSVLLALYNFGTSAGNITGPLLFHSEDAPYYRPGLQVTMAITCILIAIIALQVVHLFYLNKMHQRSRVAHGKPAILHDTSMEHEYVGANQNSSNDQQLGTDPFDDLTDSKNDEFVYVY